MNISHSIASRITKFISYKMNSYEISKLLQIFSQVPVPGNLSDTIPQLGSQHYETVVNI